MTGISAGISLEEVKIILTYFGSFGLGALVSGIYCKSIKQSVSRLIHSGWQYKK